MQNFGALGAAFALLVFVMAGCAGSGSSDGTGEDTGGNPPTDIFVPDDTGPTEDVPADEDLETTTDDTEPTPCREPCDDEDPCTENDRCAEGECRGDAVICDDGEPCTTDSCDPGGDGCVFEAGPDGPCDDADPCTENDVCIDGACAGEAVDCDDGKECTTDRCESEGGGCVNEPRTGESCDDGDPCTDDDVCTSEGLCDGTATTIDCDDGVVCTADFCDEQGVCHNIPDKESCPDKTCVAGWCDLEDGCLQAGVVAAQPAQDGSLGDWLATAQVAGNNFVSNTSGGELREMLVSVSGNGLHLGVEGRVDANHAWIVYLDLDYGNGTATGATDLAAIGTTGGALATVASSDIAISDPLFGADFFVGGIGPNGVVGIDANVGCRHLTNPAEPMAVSCTVSVEEATKGIEISVPWDSVPGGLPAEGELRHVAGFAVVIGVMGNNVSNQFLPGQLPAIDEFFVFPLAGGECLLPYCGDGAVDPGELCDDGNDDPLDDCDGCRTPVPESLVEVPAGEFLMGRDTDVLDDASRPQHAVWLETFYLDRLEVTNAQFAAFLTARGSVFDDLGNPLMECNDTHTEIDCLPGGVFEPYPDTVDHPVGETLWIGAYLYCQWAGKRLPTEAEWEKAARGTEGWIYPWGNDFAETNLNCKEFRCHDGFTYTSPVGTFPAGASPYGALDMVGNVWEWVNDWYDGDYYQDSPYEDPRGPCPDELVCALAEGHVARGGSWDDVEDHVNTEYRYPVQSGCNSDIGFRCAVTTPPSE